MELSFYRVDGLYYYVHGWYNVRIRKNVHDTGKLIVEHYNGATWLVSGVYDSLDRAKGKVVNDIRKECLFL